MNPHPSPHWLPLSPTAIVDLPTASIVLSAASTRLSKTGQSLHVCTSPFWSWRHSLFHFLFFFLLASTFQGGLFFFFSELYTKVKIKSWWGFHIYIFHCNGNCIFRVLKLADFKCWKLNIVYFNCVSITCVSSDTILSFIFSTGVIQ